MPRIGPLGPRARLIARRRFARLQTCYGKSPNLTRGPASECTQRERSSFLAIAALAIALPLPAFAYTGEKLERSVNVSAARAKAAALKKEPGTIVGMELEKEKGGTGIRYTFTISIRGIKHEVGIDANTGVVLEDILEGKNPD